MKKYILIGLIPFLMTATLADNRFKSGEFNNAKNNKKQVDALVKELDSEFGRTKTPGGANKKGNVKRKGGFKLPGDKNDKTPDFDNGLGNQPRGINNDVDERDMHTQTGKQGQTSKDGSARDNMSDKTKQVYDRNVNKCASGNATACESVKRLKKIYKDKDPWMPRHDQQGKKRLSKRDKDVVRKIRGSNNPGGMVDPNGRGGGNDPREQDGRGSGNGNPVTGNSTGKPTPDRTLGGPCDNPMSNCAKKRGGTPIRGKITQEGLINPGIKR